MKANLNANLSEIFSGINDPKLEKTFTQLTVMVDDLCKQHKGKIIDYDAQQLLRLFQEREKYLTRLEDLRVFTNLTYFTNMLDKDAQALKNKFEVILIDFNKKLSFILLEITKLISSNSQLIHTPILSPYSNLLKVYLSFAPHFLSEKEEQLILEKDQFGIRAWSNLQKKWAGSQEMSFEIDGELIKFHSGELRKYLASRNRKTREKVLLAALKNSAESGEIYSFALRSICNDWITNCKRRNYSSPIEYSLKSNEITQEILDSMFDAIDKNVHLYHRVLKIYSKLLALPKMADYDFDAPLPDAPDKLYPWESGKEIILEAFSKFDPEFTKVAKTMFDKNHIDATPRKGKANGAWCNRWYGGNSSFIVQTYNETKMDLFTLAHELGHSVHFYFIIPKQTILNSMGTMVTAESASFFGELLLTELLLEKAETKAEKKDILVDLVKRIGHLIWGLTAMYKFETNLYKSIESGKFLNYETICDLWVTERDKIYADNVEWIENSEFSWATVPHYYLPTYRYYNYPYIFAQLFVYALYQQFKKDKEAFIPKFKQLLEAGRSLSPKQLGEIVGLDITKPEFWELGIKQYEFFIKELESLLDN